MSAAGPAVNILGACFAQIRGRGLRVVFPEHDDGRIVAAAQELKDRDLATPILLANPQGSDRLDTYAEAYLEGRPDANPKIARRLAAKPLFHAGLMVKTSDADAMIAGAASTTARVIEAGMLTVGLAPGCATPSSFFLMLFAERALIFADCAVNAQPVKTKNSSASTRSPRPRRQRATWSSSHPSIRTGRPFCQLIDQSIECSSPIA